MNNNVIIIGGGPCGLEASAQLHQMGYNVILVEREPQLGGHLAKWDRLFPEGIKAKEVLDQLIAKINGVKYFLNIEFVFLSRDGISDSYNEVNTFVFN